MVNYRSLIKEQLPFFRKIPDNYPQLDWDIVEKLNYAKCHWGQRKCFFSELEFLSMAAKHYNLADCVVLYIGAAPGYHTNILIEMFPMLKWILYDPNNFAINKKYIENNSVDIHTGDDGFYVDATTKDVLNNPFVFGKKILFMSDIRKSTDDKNVSYELVCQQRWIIELNAEMFMLKLRFPFDYSKNWVYKMDDIEDKVIYDGDHELKSGEFLYLDGIVQLQIYAPAYSAETRLINRKINGKYHLKHYNMKQYEQQLFYFNEVDRLKEFKFLDSDKLKYHLLGYDDGYESVCEYYLARKFLKVFNHNFDFDSIVKLLYNINKDIIKITNRDFFDCPYRTFLKYFDKLGKSDNKADQLNLVENKKKSAISIISLYKNTLKSLNLQQIYLTEYKSKYPILNPSEYELQLYKISDLTKSTETFISKLELLL